MSKKLTYDLFLECALDWLSGDKSYAAVAQERGVSAATLRKYLRGGTAKARRSGSGCWNRNR